MVIGVCDSSIKRFFIKSGVIGLTTFALRFWQFTQRFLMERRETRSLKTAYSSCIDAPRWSILWWSSVWRNHKKRKKEKKQRRLSKIYLLDSLTSWLLLSILLSIWNHSGWASCISSFSASSSRSVIQLPIRKFLWRGSNLVIYAVIRWSFRKQLYFSPIQFWLHSFCFRREFWSLFPLFV